MAIMQIRIWPDDALAEVAKPIEDFGTETQTLVDDMFETMYKANGVGLAATQVAVDKRLVVIDLNPSGDPDPDYQRELDEWGYQGPVVLINPEIVDGEGAISWNEGCLSLPGITETIKRKGEVTVRALDRDGQPFEHTARGLYAVALQHEIDHLDGKLFVDYLSRLKRDVIKRKMLKLKDLYDNDGVAAAND
ncbi:MAG: peptide deformylase [Myxococcota bacterium]